MFSYNEQQLFCTQYIFLNSVCILLHTCNQQGQVTHLRSVRSKLKVRILCAILDGQSGHVYTRKYVWSIKAHGIIRHINKIYCKLSLLVRRIVSGKSEV